MGRLLHDSLLRSAGHRSAPSILTTAYRTALLSSNPEVHGLLECRAERFLGMPVLAESSRRSPSSCSITWLLLRGATRERDAPTPIMVVIKLAVLALFIGVGMMSINSRQLHAVRAQ